MPSNNELIYYIINKLLLLVCHEEAFFQIVLECLVKNSLDLEIVPSVEMIFLKSLNVGAIL